MTSRHGTSWVDIPQDSDFPHENLPFGVFIKDDSRRVGVAIGDHILDLAAVNAAGLLDLAPESVTETLNPLLGDLPEIRSRVAELLSEGNDELDRVADRGLVNQAEVAMALPVRIGDYVDFYSSEEHATNLGRMFRPDGDPLLPNWKHLPIGYHGRSSTIVVSGTPIIRPVGQRKPPDSTPVYGPSTRLDIELEVGFVTGRDNAMGQPIAIADAEGYIAGLVLVNDWSARDIQAWEYQPLGPFLGKSFATTMSPWLVTLDALAPYRIPAPPQDPAPLPYLRTDPNLGVAIELQVELNGQVICRTSFRHMYWTMAQQLTHAASNGTAIRPGDLYASGTVSGSEPGSYGSLIELTWGGTKPLELQDGSTRTFLEDGDQVALRGWCGGADSEPKIGFGTCSGIVMPATG